MSRDARIDTLLDQGLILHRQGRLAEARAQYLKVLELAPDHSRSWHLLAVVALQSNQPESALRALGKALEHDPSNFAALKDFARTLAAQKQLEKALAAFEQGIGLQPQDAELHAGRGNMHYELGQFHRAIESYDEALRLDPKFAGGHFNRAMALLEVHDPEAALAGFDATVALDPAHARAHHFRGTALAALKRAPEALRSFDAALALRADYADAYLDRGLAHLELEAWEAALRDFDAAIQLAPQFPDAHNNRGNALYLLGRTEEALASYERAVALGPNFPGMHFNRAQMLSELGRYGEAVQEFDRTLALNGKFEYAAGEGLLARLQTAAWQDYATRQRALGEGLTRGERAATPFALLALSDSPQLQQQAAREWMRTRVTKITAAPLLRRRAGKLIVGYFSPDFRDHPVARLAAPIFESHDRARFEVLAFSFGSNTRDALRERVRRGVDRFMDVASQPARAVATLARQCGVDVAVDLTGLTKHCRPGIFAERAGAVQVSYLGYLGTLGAPFMDYLIADRSLVPNSQRSCYDEKIAYLPCYHVNDTVAPLGGPRALREDLGVPPGAILFGCFNSPYKITPDTFARWMRILKRVPDAKLMLQGDEVVASHLRAEARRLEVDPTRLLFGARLPLKDYVERCAALDLFLDTYPYNAGTTASDALLAGLPVLTLSGDSFASRMAASALISMGLGELCCVSAEAYEDLAVSLATDPDRLAALKQSLLARRAQTVLFDAKRFTRYLEGALEQMMHRFNRGEAPADFEISP